MAKLKNLNVENSINVGEGISAPVGDFQNLKSEMNNKLNKNGTNVEQFSFLQSLGFGTMTGDVIELPNGITIVNRLFKNLNQGANINNQRNTINWNYTFAQVISVQITHISKHDSSKDAVCSILDGSLTNDGFTLTIHDNNNASSDEEVFVTVYGKR